jgi:uncharacterized membrane protein
LTENPAPTPRHWRRAALATTLTLAALDLLWLARDRPVRSTTPHSGPLKRDPVHGPAAVVFYVFYVAAVLRGAVAPAGSWRDAARRGAGMGLFAYGTYELTNWAVLRDWPAVLVPVDIAWGVVLTGVAAAAGRAALGGGAQNESSQRLNSAGK